MINIEYGEPKNLTKVEQSIFVTFKYKANIVNAIRTFYSRYYSSENHTWELSYDSLDELKMLLPNEEFNVVGNPINNKKYNEKIVNHDIELPKGLKTKLYDYQKETFDEGMSFDKYILNLSPGLGKSCCSLAIVKKRMELGQIKRCLIIPCVATLKYNWQNEIKLHLGENAKVLGNRKNNKGVWSVKGNADKLYDLKNITKEDKWLITNIESIRNKDISDKIKKLMDKGEIDCIIVDEVHKSCNPSSQQGKTMLTLSRHCKYIYLLTGTILMNRPTDLYMPLKVVGIEESNYTQFKNKYCTFGGWNNRQIVGYRHLDDLQYKLKQVSKRLKKDEVLTELPPKVFIDEYVDMSSKQSKLYDDVLHDIINNIDNIVLTPNPLSQMIRLRQVTADTSILSSTIEESAKFNRAEELISDIVDSGDSVIVFSNWETVISNFKKRLDNKYKSAIITGKVIDREGEIAKFNSEGCNIILMTIGAGGTGLTLNKASHIIMLDEPWTATNLEQATDRCHRVGQTKSVNVYTLMCKNSIDEQIHKIILRKGAMGDALVDCKFDLRNPEVIKYLLTGEGDISVG